MFVKREFGGNMRIETLSYFLELARSKSCVRASSNLFISQQGLSKAIVGLEKELGIALFDRAGKRMELTRAGELLIPYAKKIVELQSSAISELSREYLGESNSHYEKLTIVGTPYICTRLFSLLEKDMENVGLVGYSVQEADYPEILQYTNRKDTLVVCNVHSGLLGDITKRADIKFIPLLSSDLRVLGSTSLLPEKGACVGPELFSTLPVAYYNDPMLNCIAEEIFRIGGSDTDAVVLHSSNASKILSLVKDSKAVTFTDTFSLLLSPAHENMRAQKFDEKITFYVGFIVGNSFNCDTPQGRFINRFQNIMNTRYRAYMSKHPISVS